MKTATDLEIGTLWSTLCYVFFGGGQKSITGLILPFHRANNSNLTMMAKQHYLLALLRAAEFPRKKNCFWNSLVVSPQTL